VLALMPFAVFFAITLLSPGYVRPLFDTEQGRMFLGGGLIFQVIGAFWVRKQIDFDI
jgi:tight adherence protein B